jgi:MFS family permease
MAALYGGSSIGQLGLGLTDITSRLPFVATGLLLTLAIVVLLFGRSVQPESEHSEALSLRQINRLSHAAIIGCIVSGLLLGAVYGLMPVELLNRGISHDNIGGLMAVIILGGMAVQPLIPMLSKYLGRTLLMALLCLIGVGAIALTSMNDGLYILAISLFVLGMAAFALYPVAINLGCEKLDSQYITSATQVMLISYSVGSVSGPSISGWLMADGQGLFSYLFIILLGTCIYMLLASVKGKSQAIAGE